MDRFDELKLKYQSVLNLIPQQGVKVSHVHVKDNKLYIEGAAPTEANKNAIWNQIKLVDPSLGDILCELSIDSSLVVAPPTRTYTVKPGDSLWKIAAENLGNGTLYPKIVAANPGRLKDEKTVIHPGDILNLPS